MVIRLSVLYTNLLTLLFVLIPVFSPTHAQITPTTTQTPLTDAEKTTMQAKAKTMIELLNRGEYTKARELLAPSFASQLTTEEIRTIWGNTINKFGQIHEPARRLGNASKCRESGHSQVNTTLLEACSPAEAAINT